MCIRDRPMAGPTGGEGFAAPAGIFNLMYPSIFFAIITLLYFYSFSTCVNSKSTGVDLPKIDTETLSLDLSSSISSTKPLKL